MKLSICFGTLNRIEFLKPCLESVRQACGDLEKEIIIADGGSTDGTLDYLRAQDDVKLIEQGQRLGACRAFNEAFLAAQGEYVVHINDDCLVIGDTFYQAALYLDSHPRCGQVAIPYGDGKQTPQTQIIPNRYAQLVHGHNLPYANFSVTRRDLGNKIGWWGDKLSDDKKLYHYGGDVFLSVMVWTEGYTVDVLPRGNIIHYQPHDDTRIPNVESYMLDRIFMPARAWEHELAQTKQKRKADARAEAQRLIANERAKQRGAGVLNPNAQPLNNPVRLRYLGLHRALATYTDTPSRRIYRIRLKARLEFYADSADVDYFVKVRRDEFEIA